AAAEWRAKQTRPTLLVAASRVNERVAGRERDGVERDDLRALVDDGEVVEALGVCDDRLAVVEVDAHAGQAPLVAVELSVEVRVRVDATEDDLLRREEAAADAHGGTRLGGRHTLACGEHARRGSVVELLAFGRVRADAHAVREHDARARVDAPQVEDEKPAV